MCSLVIFCFTSFFFYTCCNTFTFLSSCKTCFTYLKSSLQLCSSKQLRREMKDVLPEWRSIKYICKLQRMVWYSVKIVCLGFHFILPEQCFNLLSLFSLVVNKSKMLSAGVADVVLKFLQSEMPPVQFKLLGTLRMLIDTQGRHIICFTLIFAHDAWKSSQQTNGPCRHIPDCEAGPISSNNESFRLSSVWAVVW